MFHELITGTEFEWEGAVWRIVDVSSNNDNARYISVIDVDSYAERTITQKELLNAWAVGDLLFVTYTREGARSEAEPKYPEELELLLSDYDETQQERARYRFMVIEPLIGLRPSQRGKTALKRRVEEIRAWQKEHGIQYPISSRSIQRWMRHYEASGGDIRSLLDNRAPCGRPGGSRLDAEVEELVQEEIKKFRLTRYSQNVDSIVEILAHHIEVRNASRDADDHLTLPSRDTIMRRINAVHTKTRIGAQQGRVAAAKATAQAGMTPYPNRLLAQVEIDHTKVPVIAIDEEDNLPLGYGWYTSVLDRASRFPLGAFIGFEHPSYMSVMQVLYHAILPKPDVREQYDVEHTWLGYGIPAEIIVDNGREFIGNDLRQACLELGITLTQAPVGCPAFKGGVERIFRTFKGDLFHNLDGRKVADWGLQEPDSIETSCLSLNEIDEILNIYTLDIYAERFHRGLGDIPARVWERGISNGFTPRLPTSAKHLWIQLCRTETRMMHHYGVQLANLRYNCPELGLLRIELDHKYRNAGRAKVKVKWSPSDLSRVFVLNEFEEPGSERSYIEVPAVNQEYTYGMSIWKHRVVLRELRRVEKSVNKASLGRARLRIQEVIMRARSRKRSHRQTNAKIGRYQDKNMSTNPFESTHPGESTSPDAGVPPLPPRSSARISGLMLEGEGNDNHTIDEVA
jgi:putative transposase